MVQCKSSFLIYVFLGLSVLANFAVWKQSNEQLPKWANVPPAPSVIGAKMSFMGDSELAYRSLALTLQEFGNTSGQIMPLKDYNYKNLGTWFDLEDKLNPHSDYVPFMAAYYFGSSQDPSELMPVINYLRRVGTYPDHDKWRYFGQAVFLARHKMKNMPLALELADEMAKAYKPGMPGWVVQMRSIIASDMGEKEMAYNLMVDSLMNKSEGLDPLEVKFMLDQICNHLLASDQKKTNKLCSGW